MTNYNESTSRPGNCAFDEQKILSFTYLDYPQILCRNTAITHMTGHPHVLKDSAWKQTLADCATTPVPTLGTVSHITAGKLMPSNDALKPFSLAGPNHVHVLASLKLFYCNFITDIKLHWFFSAIFPNEASRRRIGFLTVTNERLAGILFFPRTQTDLYGMIPIVFRRFLLQNGTGPQFNDRDTDEVAVCVEQLCHAEFFAEKFHD